MIKRITVLLICVAILVSVLCTSVVKGEDMFFTKEMTFTGLNSTRIENSLIIYKDRATTSTNQWGGEVCVDAEGYIISIGGNNNTIPEGGLVLSAIGDKLSELTRTAVLGMSVTVDYSSKKIVFSFQKENCLKQIDIQTENCKSEFETALAEYRNIDVKAAEESFNRLEVIRAVIKTALDGGDNVTAEGLKSEIDGIIGELSTLLLEIPPVEARAIWVRPTEKSTAEVKLRVKEIYRMGYNIICLEILYNCTMIIPMPEELLFEQSPLFKGFDVLKAYAEQAHKFGIELHAWMSVYRVGHDGSTYKQLSLANKKSEWRNIANTGIDYVPNQYGNNHYLNPALNEVNELLLSVYRHILVNYDIDGFQLDYIRYPDSTAEIDYGYDEYTRELYRSQYDIDPKNIVRNTAQWDNWVLFRAKFVTDFILRIKELIAEVRPDVYLSCDVAPTYSTGLQRMYQDTASWLKNGIIEIVYPMAYGNDAVLSCTEDTVKLAGDGAYVYMGMGEYGSDVYIRQVNQTRDGGTDGVAFFEYSGYKSGNYERAVLDSVFRLRSVSPSYNAKAAVEAQLKFAMNRIEIISERSEADGALLAPLNLKIEGIITALETSELAENAERINELQNELDSIDISEKARNSLVCDIKKVQKYFALSKDDDKLAYRIEHPLPEMYDINNEFKDESKSTVSSEPSEDTGEQSKSDSQPTENTSEPIVKKALDSATIKNIAVALIAATAICVISVIIFRNAKKKKDNEK